MNNAAANAIPEHILHHYRKIEDEYQRNLQVYQSLFYQNPDAVFSLDLNGKFVSANKAMLQKCECTLPELLNFEFRNFVHPDYLALINTYFTEAKKGIIKKFEIKIVNTQGQTLDVCIKNMPIYVNDTIEGIYCIATEVTKKLQANQKVKLALQNLKKANLEKDNILKSITEGFFAIDNSWKFLYCNKVVEQIFGVKNDQITGRHFWDLIDMGNAPIILVEFNKAMQLKEKVGFELFYKPLRIWLDITAYPTENGLSCIVKIINEEKRIEQLFILEKEALELNADIKTTAESVIAYLLDGLQNIHHDMICSLMYVKDGKLLNGYSRDLPEGYSNLAHGLPIGMNQGSCGTAAFIKQAVIVEDISNSTIWDEYKEIAAEFGFKACWSLPLLDKEKNVFATFGIYYKTCRKPSTAEMNSMERMRNLLTTIIINKQAEEEILLSKERYDIVAKATNDAIWDCDINTRKVIWNNGISTIFGYHKEDLYNTLDWTVSKIHHEDKLSVIRKIVQQIKTQESTFSHEFRFLCRDGTIKYVQNKMFIICDATNKKAIRIIGALQDITQQKQTELKLIELNEALQVRAEQLATSNTELERFAYVASHDLQEPLRTITSFLQLFKRKYQGIIDETADNYINFAVDGADRMKQLILDMLEYSRVNTQLNPNEETDMEEVMNQVLFNFSGKLKTTQAEIVSKGKLPKIFAVKTQMTQVLQNLISNAIKYQQKDHVPHVEVSAIESKDEWTFSVADNGIGIEEKYFDKIFIIFQRLHSKTQYAGTGIGLAICKKIIEKHGGKIWLTSIQNKGTTFYFTIPKKSH